MTQEAADRIRSASFSLARRGYDREEVESFLAELATTLESEAPSDDPIGGARAELSQVGERTAEILTKAHDAAEEIRSAAESEARQQVEQARADAEAARSRSEQAARALEEEAQAQSAQARAEAEAHAELARSEADAYAEQTRSAAQTEAEQTVSRARTEAQETLEAAREEGERTLAEWKARHAEIEAVVASLEEGRDSVVGELERLARQAAAAALQIRGVHPPAPEGPEPQSSTEGEGEPARP